MQSDPAGRPSSVYVGMGDGVRLAVDIWLPPAAGDDPPTPVGTAVRMTRYHRAESVADGDTDTNAAAAAMWNGAGFALVVADARGSGASFGCRAGELSEREIEDYDELVSWIAVQPWSNGRVGAYGGSYEGQAAELLVRHRNPHLVAVAALFSPYDPYRELFYPGGCATGARFARWMCESQVKDGVAGAVDRLAELTGLPADQLALPAAVKPVDGPDGPALLAEAIAEHQENTDVHELLSEAPFRDDRVAGLDWTATAPASAAEQVEQSGVPLLIRAGWLDGAFAAGALARFATAGNHQQVEIGPWGHGGGTFADPLRPDGRLVGERLGTHGQDRRLVEFLARHLDPDHAPLATAGLGGSGETSELRIATLGSDEWRTLSAWPPVDSDVRRWYLDPGHGLTPTPAEPATERWRVDPETSTGEHDRWLAIDQGRAPEHPDRRAADERLLTFTSAPLPTDLHVLGFPVLSFRLATSGTDGAVYAYLETVGPHGEPVYLTEGCLRLLHRRTTGPVSPAGAGGSAVGRTYARADALPVVPGEQLDIVVELLPISALVPAGHRLRVAIAGHDAACFTRYGPEDETFTITFGRSSHLELPLHDVGGAG